MYIRINFAEDVYGITKGKTGYYISAHTMRWYNDMRNIKRYCMMNKKECDIILNLLNKLEK